MTQQRVKSAAVVAPFRSYAGGPVIGLRAICSDCDWRARWVRRDDDTGACQATADRATHNMQRHRQT